MYSTIVYLVFSSGKAQCVDRWFWWDHPRRSGNDRRQAGAEM